MLPLDDVVWVYLLMMLLAVTRISNFNLAFDNQTTPVLCTPSCDHTTTALTFEELISLGLGLLRKSNVLLINLRRYELCIRDVPNHFLLGVCHCYGRARSGGWSDDVHTAVYAVASLGTLHT